jgi:hypothetical protein
MHFAILISTTIKDSSPSSATGRSGERADEGCDIKGLNCEIEE